MDSPPKLAGETLIVHHIPLVHCQVPDRQCCSGSKRTNPFGQPELGVRRPASLLEQDLLQADSLVCSGVLQAPGAPAQAADDQARDAGTVSIPKRHNPFLQSQREGHELLGDSPGHRSFHLHGSMVAGNPTFSLHELPPFHLHAASHGVTPWSTASRAGVVDGQEDRLPSAEVQKRHNINRCPLASECMQVEECSYRPGSSSLEGADLDWNNGSEESGRTQDAGHSRTCSCSSPEHQHCRGYSTSSQSETGDQQMGYVSDSSCNSSDGVLVNFSTLYNKAHGHSRSNWNSASLSCDDSFCSHSDTGAFYLDLHSSPTESKMPCESQPPERARQGCGCHHLSSPVLDANCNSYHLHCEPCPAESTDLTACFQSQARLVVATQNYYKLVTCDLSSQSSPSPAGSSITSCSEEHTRGSPAQPTEYYLFRRPEAKPEESDGEGRPAEAQGTTVSNVIEGQVYVNVSPPTLSAGRPRSRSYDRNLDRSPTARLGSLERMLSCPGKLGDGPVLALLRSPPKRVTSFAELAKGRKRNGSSPPLRTSGDSSLEFSPIPELQPAGLGLSEDCAQRCQSLPPMPFGRCLNQSCEGSRVEAGAGASPRACSGKDAGAREHPAPEQAPLSLRLGAGAGSADGPGQRDVRARADGGGGDSRAVVRYSKEQRPTTLPIQPFVFQHHFSKPPKARALQSHLAASLSQLYSTSASRQPASHSQSSASATSAEPPGGVGGPSQAALLGQRGADGAASLSDGYTQKPAPESTRPSPLGSYSPAHSAGPFFHSQDSSSCSPTPERVGESHPPRSRSCPLSASLLPTRASPAADAAPPCQESPRPGPRQEPLEQSAQVSKYWFQGGSLPPLALASRAAALAEPQWRGSSEAGGSGPLNSVGVRPLNGQPTRQLQLGYADFFPEYFSLAEKPPAEFCLSPESSTESISIDLLQKKGLVKAINTAVDLIVAHFGTSRDPGVKAKLGNSSVSPNVGHLILKYLCPAIWDILSDGLKAHVLDLIVGQRKNTPWSVVEASTQLGPSTKVLHSLYSRVSQLTELTSHSMRFNAFVFGLLNLRSLEFWFSHLHNHEDVVLAHYQPAGFLCLAHGACQPLFDELLLLLQPLSLLPFSLDLLFEDRLRRTGQEQQQQKELLRVQQDMLLSAHSTLQLMRSRGRAERPEGWSASGQEEGAGEGRRDRQAGWWYQLMQSSQVYIEGSAQGSRFPRPEKKRAGAGPRPAEGGVAPPPREGVVEGAEAVTVAEEAGQERRPGAAGDRPGEVGDRRQPSWMGSPPDSVLCELKRSKEKGGGAPPREQAAAPPAEDSGPGAPDTSQPIKWGRLFGARNAQKEARQPNRLPSGWLTLDRAVFQRVAQTVGAGVWREAAPEPERPQAPQPRERPEEQPPRAPSEVKALCHHIATEAGQLSFNKGAVLRVLAEVDSDWLRCSLGSQSGLVPVAYVTPLADEDY
ncbi:AP-4 complex accessory subunit RUSC2 isoform X2 [Carettochelys insculpta]|uniref:AP-4 complex accessory subunit RUSC2 isoform X2 n=1 Tax=Carettochelys insculpta TaxID=44489 RepID=UPI003EBF6103